MHFCVDFHCLTLNVLLFFACAVDCKWRWGDYTPCSATCGGGIATRYAIIIQPAEHDGKSCPPNVVNRVADTKNCKPNPCPSKVLSHLV